MVLSRKQSKDVLEHLLKSVVGLSNNDPEHKALEKARCKNVFDFMALSFQDFELMPYDLTDNDGTTHEFNLKKCETGILKALSVFLRSIGTMTYDEYMSITQEQYDEYRTGNEFGNVINLGTFTATPHSSSASSNTSKDPLYEFKRGINCNPSLLQH